MGMSARMLEVSLLRLGNVIHLERDAWSTANGGDENRRTRHGNVRYSIKIDGPENDRYPTRHLMATDGETVNGIT